MSARGLPSAKGGHRPFGSTLTASGYALTGAAGLLPLGPVVGCDVRSLSVQLPLPTYRQAPYLSSRVLDAQYASDVLSVDELDHQVTDARQRAYGQLRAGAAQLGADAVIDVHQIQSSVVPLSTRLDLGRVAAAVSRGPHPYFARTLEYQLIGTAVRDPAQRSERPHLSGVSASDFWKLRRAGWQAIDVVGGSAHRFGASLWVGVAGHEVQGATAIWTAAREAAYAQLQAELTQVQADGVIDIKTESAHHVFDWAERVEVLGQTGRSRRSSVGRKGLLVSVHLLGTAVRRLTAATDGAAVVTRMMDLR